MKASVGHAVLFGREPSNFLPFFPIFIFEKYKLNLFLRKSNFKKLKTKNKVTVAKKHTIMFYFYSTIKDHILRLYYFKLFYVKLCLKKITSEYCIISDFRLIDY